MIEKKCRYCEYFPTRMHPKEDAEEETSVVDYCQNPKNADTTGYNSLALAPQVFAHESCSHFTERKESGKR